MHIISKCMWVWVCVHTQLQSLSLFCWRPGWPPQWRPPCQWPKGFSRSHSNSKSRPPTYTNDGPCLKYTHIMMYEWKHTDTKKRKTLLTSTPCGHKWQLQYYFTLYFLFFPSVLRTQSRPLAARLTDLPSQQRLQLAAVTLVICCLLFVQSMISWGGLFLHIASSSTTLHHFIYLSGGAVIFLRWQCQVMNC